MTDSGEVIAAVPRSETTLAQGQVAPPPPPAPAPAVAEAPGDDLADEDEQTPMGGAATGAARARAGAGGGAMPKKADARPRVVAAAQPAPRYAGPAAADTARRELSQPRDVRALAAIAMEGGVTRYDLPMLLNIPDKSATMVLLASRQVPGEAIFLFAPDGGVSDSMTHPFRVARFTNKTGGVIEKGPIAVFELGNFLGQGMVDPLPDGATATVPFALERAIAIELERKFDETGERIAKIENGELSIERDAVTQTKYRIRNGGDHAAKLLVKHPRQSGTRLFQPPKDTEDNVGTGSALVPTKIDARSTGELVVDERQTNRRREDWFTPVADNAVKAYLQDPRADASIAAKLSAAWGYRTQILSLRDARQKLAQEQVDLQHQTEETRRNLRAIEKNKTADALRAKLTQRLGEMAARLDEITKHVVETDSKLAELGVRFKEGVREIKVAEPLPPKP